MAHSGGVCVDYESNFIILLLNSECLLTHKFIDVSGVDPCVEMTNRVIYYCYKNTILAAILYSCTEKKNRAMHCPPHLLEKSLVFNLHSFYCQALALNP